MSIVFSLYHYIDILSDIRYDECVKSLHTIKLEKAIVDLGLDQVEARIYIAALEISGGTVTEIARTGHLERTGIYYHIDKLIEIGFLYTANRGQRQIYLPADPLKLKDLAEQKQRSLLEFLPLLQEQFSRQNNKSIVSYYQGVDGLNQFYDKMYKHLQELDSTNNTVSVLGHNYTQVMQYYKNKLDTNPPQKHLGVATRVINPRSEKPRGQSTNDTESYLIARFNLPPAEYKYIDDKYAYEGSIVLIADHIYSIDFRNLFASISENRNLAHTWQMFFNFIWDHLK